MNNGHYDFIEIGTSDFDTLIELSDESTVGLSIEPIKYYLDRLPNKKNVKKLQVAVSDTDGSIDIYYIPDDKIQEHYLSWWIRGSNSINGPHPFVLKELGHEFYDSIVTIEKVPTVSWSTLVRQQNIQSIGYLKIDTEGFDHVILNDYLKMCETNPKLLAKKIKFECHPEVSNVEEIEKIIPKFKDYYVEHKETDIILTRVKIPRIIHQTYKTNQLPIEILEVINNLISLNPEFEYRFYNDDDCYNFIRDNYDSETLDLYSSINPSYGSAKSDFFRYLLMYKVGGVYLDIKSFAEIPLKDIILPTDEYLLTHWAGKDFNDILGNELGEFQNWHIICAPNHPFLKKTIEMVKENIRNYSGGSGKLEVLKLTGPIVYSRAILKLLNKLKTNQWNSPVREYRLENELGLVYMKTSVHHSTLYGTNVSENEPIIMWRQGNKVDKSYVLCATESYFDIVSTCVKSIREFSKLPIYVYMLNSDLKVDVENTTTIRWDCDIEDTEVNVDGSKNFYIDRVNDSIYKILIQRPLITKDVLKNHTKIVTYVDSDSIATKYVDRIFDMYDSSVDYPYFVEGIYDYLHYNGRGGAETKKDLTTTLEHPACELFNVDQYVRERYRQTGYYVAGQNSIKFLDEWYWMCVNPYVLEDFQLYAPYHEETIMNVLLWKYKIMDGLPYIYVNGGLDVIDRVYNEPQNLGKHVSSWLRYPDSEENILFFHGEKRIDSMNQMIEKLKSQPENKKIKILFVTPHLSTGGMPAYVLKKIEEMSKLTDEFEMFFVEYCNFSDTYVVQKNKIKELIKPENYWTLESDKSMLIDIIKNNNIDIVHVDEMLEGFESFNQVSLQLLNKLYDNDRTWKMVETCHNVWFNPKTMKKYNPDAYAFCTPYHQEVTFKDVPSYSEVMEYPIDYSIVSEEEKIESKKILGLDLGKKHIVNVGIWTEGKNQSEGVEIARLLPDVQFHFIGNQAPNFESYWGPVMENLPSNVKVWGERDDVSTFLKSCDVFMFNSKWECNPLVLREAASYGLKIVARNLPQYMGMFDKYITEINDDINITKDKIVGLLESGTPPYVNQLPKNQSEEFGKKFIDFYKKVSKFKPTKQEKINSVNIIQNYIEQPYLEIKGDSDKLYTVKFFDESGRCEYNGEIKINHWVRLNKQYYKKWTAKVWEGDRLIYDNTLNFKDKRIYIAFDSKSLGDTVGWIPYVLEFQKKHECQVIVSTFWNKLFKNSYPEIEFIEPGQPATDIVAMYKIGWYFNENREPERPNVVPLQKAITNIIGLDFKEIKPNIDFTPKEKPYNTKYITIANESTSGLKFWNNPTGWQDLVNYLVGLGYKVINVSKNGEPLKNVTKISDTSIENTMNVIHHSEFFIGLSSGLSWLSWGLGKHVVMISNFTESDHEFTSNCTRITNPSVCNSCWNNPKITFDKGDWYWCPEHKGTERHFECHKSITADMVINSIQHLIK